MSRDQIEALLAFCGENVEFMVVGAHALAVHSVPRATGDLDIFVRATRGNASRVWRALAKFGAPLQDVSPADFENSDIVFQVGLPPARIDVITGISGVEFEDAWPRRVTVELAGMRISFIGREDLIRNKRAAGRLKDLADVERLEQLKAPDSAPAAATSKRPRSPRRR